MSKTAKASGRGAEAVVSESKIIGLPVVVKDRIPKSYRIQQIDKKLRTERTRREARLLNKAKLAGVPCPTVLEVKEFSISMTKLVGKRPDFDARGGLKFAKLAGEYLGKLHAADIIHGDFTPANLVLTKTGLYVIDFGLGFTSFDIEDKAVDVLTMLKAISVEAQIAFLDGYATYNKSNSVLKRVEDVKKRARYVQG
jgi:Kae1-associated kinase Bud32